MAEEPNLSCVHCLGELHQGMVLTCSQQGCSVFLCNSCMFSCLPEYLEANNNCPVCGEVAGFRYLPLEEAMRSHLNAKPRQCRVSDREFNGTHDELQSHLSVAHQEIYDAGMQKSANEKEVDSLIDTICGALKDEAQATKSPGQSKATEELPRAKVTAEMEDHRCISCLEQPHQAVIILCEKSSRCRSMMCNSTVFNCAATYLDRKQKQRCPVCRDKSWQASYVPAEDQIQSELNAKERECEFCDFVGSHEQMEKHSVQHSKIPEWSVKAAKSLSAIKIAREEVSRRYDIIRETVKNTLVDEAKGVRSPDEKTLLWHRLTEVFSYQPDYVSTADNYITQKIRERKIYLKGEVSITNKARKQLRAMVQSMSSGSGAA